MSDTTKPTVATEKPWPIPVSAEQTMRTLIRNCARPAGRSRVGARPRWSVVSDLTTHGSTYSAWLCQWAGFDPDELVVRRK
jgi:hypothetical protein